MRRVRPGKSCYQPNAERERSTTIASTIAIITITKFLVEIRTHHLASLDRTTMTGQGA